MSAFDFEQQLQWLAERGLNRVAFVPRMDGPCLPAGVSQVPGCGLLIFLSLGSTFGAQTAFGTGAQRDPFDARSAALVNAFGQRLCAASSRPFELLYPGSARLDLRAWLAAGAVQFRSPIGIGIRPDCGSWLAVRAACWTVLSQRELESLRARYPLLRREHNPCLVCDGTPCVRACPAQAVSPPFAAAPMQPKALERCLQRRLQPDSDCALQCLARNACPVGSHDRYPDAQMRYHYGVSLAAIRRWRERSQT